MSAYRRIDPITAFKPDQNLKKKKRNKETVNWKEIGTNIRLL